MKVPDSRSQGIFLIGPGKKAGLSVLCLLGELQQSGPMCGPFRTLQEVSSHVRACMKVCVCVCGLITASDECLLDSLLTPDVPRFSQHLNCLGLWASQTWLSAQPPASEGSRSRVGSFIMAAPVPITVHNQAKGAFRTFPQGEGLSSSILTIHPRDQVLLVPPSKNIPSCSLPRLPPLLLSAHPHQSHCTGCSLCLWPLPTDTQVCWPFTFFMSLPT